MRSAHVECVVKQLIVTLSIGDALAVKVLRFQFAVAAIMAHSVILPEAVRAPREHQQWMCYEPSRNTFAAEAQQTAPQKISVNTMLMKSEALAIKLLCLQDVVTAQAVSLLCLLGLQD